MEGLRPDGRRWNELRRLNCQISTSTSSTTDGSSYIEQGYTKVICNVTGPAEPSQRSRQLSDRGTITVEVNFAAFSGTDRIRRGRNDKKIQEMQSQIQHLFSSAILVKTLARSEVTITLHVLSIDGSTLAACINAATLALIDAGIPLLEYVTACTAGQSSPEGDPWLDVNWLEENDIPSLTVATVGDGEKIGLLNMESRVRLERLEGMLAVGISGCGRVREIMDEVVRKHGKKIARLEEQT